MEITGDEGGNRLACGTELALLVDQVADEVPSAQPDHQASCPHCQTALRELEELWGHVRELARGEVVVPNRLVERVIGRIRDKLRALGLLVPLEIVVPRLLRHALLHGPQGTTRIADLVVARLVARVVRELRGVHAVGSHEARMMRASLVPLPRTAAGVSVEVQDYQVQVDLRLVIMYGKKISQVTADVRRAVIQKVEALTGLEVTEVNLTVDDLYLP